MLIVYISEQFHFTIEKKICTNTFRKEGRIKSNSSVSDYFFRISSSVCHPRTAHLTLAGIWEMSDSADASSSSSISARDHAQKDIRKAERFLLRFSDHEIQHHVCGSL